MKTPAIVDLLDEGFDAVVRLGQVSIRLAVDLFVLQGAYEALGHGIVPRAANTAHAWLYPGCNQPLDIIAAGVLHPAVRVMDKFSGNNRARRQCLLQSLQSKARL